MNTRRIALEVEDAPEVSPQVIIARQRAEIARLNVNAEIRAEETAKLRAVNAAQAANLAEVRAALAACHNIAVPLREQLALRDAALEGTPAEE